MKLNLIALAFLAVAGLVISGCAGTETTTTTTTVKKDRTQSSMYAR